MAITFDYTDKLAFLAEWFDYESAYLKKFLLNYYPSDGTLELFDATLERIYLKRSACDTVRMADMFVGNSVRIYGRQIKLTDYADGRTRAYVGRTKQHTFALLKPSIFPKIGELIHIIEEMEFQIIALKMVRLNQNQIIDFYQSDEKELSLPFIVENMICGPVIALEMVGNEALTRWKDLIGPTDPVEARKTNPRSLRALYGVEKFSNGFHAADSHEIYTKERDFFFKHKLQHNLELTNSTCCVIKPHAIKEGKLGLIIEEIMKEFKITAMQMFDLTKPNAEEFLEVYKGAITDYSAFLISYLEGPCVALEISGDNPNIHAEFRKFVGPQDSEVARQIRPNTLRAKFGVNKYQNAIHCTDLEEDTTLEIEFFFKILS